MTLGAFASVRAITGASQAHASPTESERTRRIGRNARTGTPADITPRTVPPRTHREHHVRDARWSPGPSRAPSPRRARRTPGCRHLSASVGMAATTVNRHQARRGRACGSVARVAAAVSEPRSGCSPTRSRPPRCRHVARRNPGSSWSSRGASGTTVQVGQTGYARKGLPIRRGRAAFWKGPRSHGAQIVRPMQAVHRARRAGRWIGVESRANPGWRLARGLQKSVPPCIPLARSYDERPLCFLGNDPCLPARLPRTCRPTRSRCPRPVSFHGRRPAVSPRRGRLRFSSPIPRDDRGDPLARAICFTMLEQAEIAGHPCRARAAVSPALAGKTLDRLLENECTRSRSVSTVPARRRTKGSANGAGHFQRTIDTLKALVAQGFTVQVNTTVMRRNVEELRGDRRTAAPPFGVQVWEVFYLVSRGADAASRNSDRAVRRRRALPLRRRPPLRLHRAHRRAPFFRRGGELAGSMRPRVSTSRRTSTATAVQTPLEHAFERLGPSPTTHPEGLVATATRPIGRLRVGTCASRCGASGLAEALEQRARERLYSGPRSKCAANVGHPWAHRTREIPTTRPEERRLTVRTNEAVASAVEEEVRDVFALARSEFLDAAVRAHVNEIEHLPHLHAEACSSAAISRVPRRCDASRCVHLHG